MSSLVVGGFAILAPGPAHAQELRAGAHVVAAATRADPVPGGDALTEVRLVHPVLHLEAGGVGPFRLIATADLEGLTIPNGELNPGAAGEGFVDRRHPHTYVHQLLLTAGTPAVSLTLGKGFAPFGSDDPMMRPALRYPVNHHLAQILERAVLIGAVGSRRLAAEAGLFNGDEPERPGQWPRIGGRFGDSWAVRLTGVPSAGIELQGSHARVSSPEHRPGQGTDQQKWSLSARWSRPLAGEPVEGLLEWVRTSEAGGFFVFHSILAEGAWSPVGGRLHYRFERTERPEEERSGAFRTRRPHLENSILGITRWTIHTFGGDFDAGRLSGVRIRPLLELSAGSVASVGGGLFDVAAVYGRSHFWSLSLGIRLGAGDPMPRMGRYGAAAMERSGHHVH